MTAPISSDDSLAKAISFLSTDRMTEALSILQRFDIVTWAELDDLITVGVFDPDIQRGMFTNARRNRDNGVPWPCMVPGLDVELRIAISHSFHIADRIGGITALGSMVFEPHVSIDSWRIYRPDILTENAVEGSFAIMAGMPRMGKTSGGGYIMEQDVKVGKVVISNILIRAPVEGYRYVKDAKALFETIGSIPAGTKWRFVLDEGGLVANKKDAMTKRVKELEGLFRVMGKLEGSLLFIEQRPESVPTILQEWSRSRFYAIEPGLMFIDLDGPNLRFRRTVRDFPPTSLPYDTRDVAYFPVNINTAALFASISGANDQKEAIREFMAGRGKPAEEPTEAAPIKPCAWPKCRNTFQTTDGRRRYCEEHISTQRMHPQRHSAGGV